MPKNKKSADAHPTKNFDPRYGAKKPHPKAGSKSPKHRGYRAETTVTGAPKKQRWNAEERARRAEPTARPTDAAASRPARDHGSRSERPDRQERPRYGDRAARPQHHGRGDHPAYGDRVARTERSGRDDRRSDGDRTQRSTDRAPRRDHDADRPRRTFDRDRPRRDHDTDRPRTDHRDSTFYPSRDAAPASGAGDQARFTPHEDVVLERLEADAILAADVEGITFGDLGLGDNITRQLAALGAVSPFPIQAATIPDVLAGKDVLGRGKTGSGKTIAFGAPLVERLLLQWAEQKKSNDPSSRQGSAQATGSATGRTHGARRQMGRNPRALILAPTRELAMQLDRTIQPIARCVGLFTITIFGGVPQHKQVIALQRGVDIVIATPGRLEDLIEQGRLDLSAVTITVVDEADHMCDLGFLEPVQRILRQTADAGQRLLFSATLDTGVAALVDEFLTEPIVHEVAGEDQESSSIDHRVLLIEQRDKRAIIEELASGDGRTLIFARTRAFAEQLADQLDDAGIPATSLHGDLNQSRRTRNLQLLTSGRVNVLVATDVPARGIHVDDISLVIQADAPDEYKSYLHRAGRTGRAGKAGTVVTLVPRSRRRRMDDLLGRAEIHANMQNAAPGDPVLQELAAL